MPVFSVNKNHRSVSADNILLKEMACDYWLQYHPSLMAAKSVDLPDDKVNTILYLRKDTYFYNCLRFTRRRFTFLVRIGF